MNRRKKIRLLVFGVLISGCIALISFLQMGENLVYFYTPDEAQAKAATLENQIVRVAGFVVPGSVVKSSNSLDLQFVLSDLKGHDIKVKHKGIPPDLFKEGQGVVVEGNLEAKGQEFSSRKLMVKHSEEYKKSGDHQSMDRELLQKSILKE